MMQSIQQFILVCNSDNLSNNIHDSQSARGPALPLCSLALPSHFLALPCISSCSPRTPFTFPHAPLAFPCAHHAPSHSLALPRTPLHAPLHSPSHSPRTPSCSSCAPLHCPRTPRTRRFYVPTAHSHPAPLSACPRCVPTCQGEGWGRQRR